MICAPAPATPMVKCESAFYAGEWELLRGHREEARASLQVAADTCPKTFVELRGRNFGAEAARPIGVTATRLAGRLGRPPGHDYRRLGMPAARKTLRWPATGDNVGYDSDLCGPVRIRP